MEWLCCEWSDILLFQSHNSRPGTMSPMLIIVPDRILTPEYSPSRWSKPPWQQIEATASRELYLECGDEAVY